MLDSDVDILYLTIYSSNLSGKHDRIVERQLIASIR